MCLEAYQAGGSNTMEIWIRPSHMGCKGDPPSINLMVPIYTFGLRGTIRKI